METAKNKQPADALPATPLTLDGSYILHQMFRLRWPAWRSLAASDQKRILDRAMARFVDWERNKEEPSALFSLLSHKGDLMFVHFRQTLDDLNHVELQLAHSRFSEFLEPVTSYL